jgi:hypothetical protein
MKCDHIISCAEFKAHLCSTIIIVIVIIIIIIMVISNQLNFMLKVGFGNVSDLPRFCYEAHVNALLCMH